jgi:hypothetical protein
MFAMNPREYIREPRIYSFILVYFNKQFFLLLVDLDKSWSRKEPGSAYDNWNISVIICDTDMP